MKTIKIPYLLRGLYGKVTISISTPEYNACKAYAEKEGIGMGEAWHQRQKEHKQTTPIVTPRSTNEVVNDALLLYPKCYDMFNVEGAQTLRQCICPNKERPIALPQKNGIFIIDDPKKCHRCKALGKRKGKKPSTTKTTSPPIKSDTVYCKRDTEWFFYGKKNCVRCFWKPTECKVKKEALKKI